MGDQVNSADQREPLESLGDSRNIKPRGKETGGLGALSWRDNDEHLGSLSYESPNEMVSTNVVGKYMCQTYIIGVLQVFPYGN